MRAALTPLALCLLAFATPLHAMELPATQEGIVASLGWKEGSVTRTFAPSPHQRWAGASFALDTLKISPELGIAPLLRDGQRHDLRLALEGSLPVYLTRPRAVALGASCALLNDFDNRRVDVTIGPRAEWLATFAGGEQARAQYTLFTGFGVKAGAHRVWLNVEAGYALSGRSGALVTGLELVLEWRALTPR